MAIDIRDVDGGVIFGVKVVPNSSRSMMIGAIDGLVKVKVAAPAEKGKANKGVVKLLAKCLGVKKKDIEIIAGFSSSVKQVRVLDVSVADMRTKLTGLNG